MPLQLWASVLLSPLHPFAFFSLLGGHPTLSSCVLPVLVPLHRASLQGSPLPQPGWTCTAWVLHCALSFPLLFSTPHCFSDQRPLSPWLSPCLRLSALAHASKIGVDWMLLSVRPWQRGHLPERSQNVIDQPTFTHLYTSITWLRAWYATSAWYTYRLNGYVNEHTNVSDMAPRSVKAGIKVTLRIASRGGVLLNVA